jgi:hypothetical protein
MKSRTAIAQNMMMLDFINKYSIDVEVEDNIEMFVWYRGSDENKMMDINKNTIG